MTKYIVIYLFNVYISCIWICIYYAITTKHLHKRNSGNWLKLIGAIRSSHLSLLRKSLLNIINFKSSILHVDNLLQLANFINKISLIVTLMLLLYAGLRKSDLTTRYFLFITFLVSFFLFFFYCSLYFTAIE